MSFIKTSRLSFSGFIIILSMSLNPTVCVGGSSYRKLKVGVPISGFKELVNVAHNGDSNSTVVTGFCIDVFRAAIDGLDYEVEHEFIPFVDSNREMAGSYSDLIDQVFYKNFDAVVGDVTITANRSLYVDFTLPFTELGYAMLVRNTDSNNNMWIFLKPLTWDLCLTGLAFFIAIAFVVLSIEAATDNKEFQGTTALETLWVSLSTVVFSQWEKLKSNLSKVVVIVWMFVFVILTSSYTATLASMLTLQQIQSLSKGSYIGFQSQSYMEGVLATNLNFKDSRLQRYKSPRDYAQALSRGSRNGGVSAIIDEIPYFRILVGKYPNKFSIINPSQNSNGFAFVFQKSLNQLAGDVSREIARLRGNGKLEMLQEAWFRSDQHISITDDDITNIDNNHVNALSLKTFGGLFVISGITSVVAIFITLYDKIWHCVKDKFLMHVRVWYT